MDVSVIISKSRTQTSTSVGQKSDALMLADLNTVYKEIFSRLATKSKKIYTTDIYYKHSCRTEWIQYSKTNSKWNRDKKTTKYKCKIQFCLRLCTL